MAFSKERQEPLIKNGKIRFVILLFACCSQHLNAQTTNLTVSKQPSSPLSISFETGRYDPAPDCKKEIGGCISKIWTSANTFKLGSKVWIRATVVNHSDLPATMGILPLPPHLLSIEVREPLGEEPGLTHWGCLIRPSCREQMGPQDPIQFSGPTSLWVIPPGKSDIVIQEITCEYELKNPGEYSVSIKIILELTEPENITPEALINNKAVKPAVASAAGLKFVVIE
jgi:hypothetical protein